MNSDMLQIRCKNNKKMINVATGTTLFDVYQQILSSPDGGAGFLLAFPPVCARVNNKVERLDFRLYRNKDVEFLDITSTSGSRAYTRSLFMVLCKAVHELFEHAQVTINIPVSNGYYCDIDNGHALTDEDVAAIRQRMQDIIDAHLPFNRIETTTEQAIEMFEQQGMMSKVKLLRSVGTIYSKYYDLDGYNDFYYGALLANTSEIHLFGLERFHEGLLLRTPSRKDPHQLGPLINQEKMFDVFKEHHHWQDILGFSTVGDFNEVVKNGDANLLINVSEALQEKKIAQIAEQIVHRGDERGKDVRVVLISGPSSSGKTTFSKRLSIQLMTCGKRPIAISMDDYFLDREITPRDEKGDYDFESVYALNIPLFNDHLNALLKGDEVELPRYDFHQGKCLKSGKHLRLGPNDILILEGIHALNPLLTESVPEQTKFRVYASALTTILLDKHNYIPTTDNRLLRRIIRDYKYRGVSAQETIRRWPSVRAGENKWIFPYQETADAMFNTALFFELAVIRSQAEPLLEQVPEYAEEYSEAYRLKKFLRYFITLNKDEIPPTSLLREFLGGSSFHY